MTRTKVKIGFESPKDLESLKQALLNSGIEKSDINYYCTPLNNGIGLKFKESNKGSLYALKLGPVGLAVGLILQVSYLFFSTDSSFFKTLIQLDIMSTLLASLSTGLVFLIMGFQLGKKKELHIVSFESGDGSKENLCMTVKTESEKMPHIQKVISSMKTASVDVAYSR